MPKFHALPFHLVGASLACAALTLVGCQSQSHTADPVPPAPLATYEPEPVQFEPIEPGPAYGGSTGEVGTTTAGSGGYSEPEPVQVTVVEPATPASRTHTIQDGDTLWEISQAYYGNGARWEEIANANPGLNPRRLTIGQDIIIP